MTAKIGLQDVRFHAPHGFYEEEHRMGNEFSIDVEVTATIDTAAREDDLGGTANYATIFKFLEIEMRKPTLLLEALAYRIAARLLDHFDNVSTVRLRLRKLNPPLGGKVAAAVVEIELGGGNGGPAGGLSAPELPGMPPSPGPPDSYRGPAQKFTFEDEPDDYGEEDYGEDDYGDEDDY